MFRSSTQKQATATKRPTNNRLIQKQTRNTRAKPSISPGQSHLFLLFALFRRFTISIPLPPTAGPAARPTARPRRPATLHRATIVTLAIIAVHPILRHGLPIAGFRSILRVVGVEGVIVRHARLCQWRLPRVAIRTAIRTAIVIAIAAMVVVAKLPRDGGGSREGIGGSSVGYAAGDSGMDGLGEVGDAGGLGILEFGIGEGWIEPLLWLGL
mmetsp:Transcript_38079/g.68619  ORF Transcript_38079/g.68619 Transcript_38079/m.68619 type:complete len:212 (-) Transcript_38079:1249-1884(-)